MGTLIKEMFNIFPSENISLQRKRRVNLYTRNNNLIREVNKKMNKNFTNASKKVYFSK